MLKMLSNHYQYSNKFACNPHKYYVLYHSNSVDDKISCILVFLVEVYYFNRVINCLCGYRSGVCKLYPCFDHSTHEKILTSLGWWWFEECL